MRALQITTPGETCLIDVPEPALEDNEVLLKVKRVGYCGSDLSTFRGLNPLVSYPRVPGHELAGTITVIGSAVSGDWKIGDKALVLPYTSCGKCSACRQGRFNTCRYNQTLGVQREGGLAEYIAVPAEKLMTSTVLDFHELALVEPLTVGFHAVDRARVEAKDTVLVFGCGAIGLGVIAGAAERGARVVAVDIDAAKLDLALKAGAKEVINSAEQSLADEVTRLTNDDGVDVVIEAIGLPQTFQAAVELVCFAGRVVYVGYAKAPVEYETKLFVQKELDVLGSRNATPKDFQAVITMLENGRFPVDLALTKTVSLDEAGEAMQAWSDNPSVVTKIQVEL
ncbi:zinc-binding alcohol dehydrogenase family protein [Rubellicoccus peritrichatus]|uniref:Zinc-binding alcohol dehydrogenase family protein n=1 Tax=Rubellicoccus peritrichatus TaxID=3080537 RepID=A0AAQ3LB56_9BACT|nr:zinc-binding alcohol dehydrogenase family protein [Puniceicoccus sp. CR14]WOO40258.1 zinc-binding alcohol dehydrogenase family protein [Puniceicoccus sp. CR14]